jgi:hypothetical protein
MGKEILLEHASDIKLLCMENHVKALFVFGSVLTDEFDEATSDMDFVVELQKNSDPIVIGESMLNLWNGLEQTFSRPVDLLRLENVRNPILKQEIEETKVVVYEA